MKRKMLLIPLVLLLIASLIAVGCAAPAPPPAPPVTPAPVAPAPAPAPPAPEEEFPIRAVMVVCPWGVGGGSDTMCRNICPEIAKVLGVPVPVANIPGASGSVGFVEAMNRRADGYTLMQVSNSPILGAVEGRNPQMYKDWVPVAAITLFSTQLYVVTESRFKTGQQLIDYAREHPRELTVGVSEVTGGDGTKIGLFATRGIEFTPVAYDTEGDKVAAVLGGHLDVWLSKTELAGSYVEAGKVRPILSIYPERTASLPEVPSLTDVGLEDVPASLVTEIRGFVIKIGTPEDRIRILADAIGEAVHSEAWGEYAKKASMDVEEGYMGTEDFTEWLDELHRTHDPKYTRIARELLG